MVISTHHLMTTIPLIPETSRRAPDSELVKSHAELVSKLRRKGFPVWLETDALCGPDWFTCDHIKKVRHAIRWVS